MRWTSVALPLVACSQVGCSGMDRADVLCAPYVAIGLSAAVSNDQTNEPICDAVVTARDGSYSEVLMPTSGCRYAGAIERAGTYSVSAERTGFASALASELKVVGTGGDCPHVRTVAVTLRLAPAK